jgi:hypothetical protein
MKRILNGTQFLILTFTLLLICSDVFMIGFP